MAAKAAAEATKKKSAAVMESGRNNPDATAGGGEDDFHMGAPADATAGGGEDDFEMGVPADATAGGGEDDFEMGVPAVPVVAAPEDSTPTVTLASRGKSKRSSSTQPVSGKRRRGPGDEPKHLVSAGGRPKGAIASSGAFDTTAVRRAEGDFMEDTAALARELKGVGLPLGGASGVAVTGPPPPVPEQLPDGPLGRPASPGVQASTVDMARTQIRELKFKDFQTWTTALPPPVGVINIQTWRVGFGKYLKVFLQALYTNQDIIEKMSDMVNSIKVQRVWTTAVTHPSASTNDYETYEMIGDKEVNLAFAKYLLKRLQDDQKAGVPHAIPATPAVLTNFTSYYMSKHYQPELASALKLDKWLIVWSELAENREQKLSNSARENVFESFMAALSFIANGVHQNLLKRKNFEGAWLDAPSSEEILRRFMTITFQGDRLDRNRAADPPVSAMMGLTVAVASRGVDPQIRRENDPLYIPLEEPRKRGKKYDITISAELVKLLRKKYGRAIPELEPVDAATRRRFYLAKDISPHYAACETAREVLLKAGITDPWIRETRATSQIKTLPKDLYERIMARRTGTIKKFIFIAPDGPAPGGDVLVLLYAIHSNNDRVLLERGFARTVEEAREQAVRLYLRSS